ncbi:hypothetical protein GCM10009069_29370 [Algimonas arctica]|uniref:Uncharacterized protein n=1 Tax=Algimonas arctica TaxID=1479486 RepID=A0A8J3G3Q8_9PROT|nr:hypothetical protein GCM10009069_29370 [Algimonas arctica]
MQLDSIFATRTQKYPENRTPFKAVGNVSPDEWREFIKVYVWAHLLKQDCRPLG